MAVRAARQTFAKTPVLGRAAIQPSFLLEIYRRKCDALFLHVYEKYPERNVAVYA